jgi:hypothetical protein
MSADPTQPLMRKFCSEHFHDLTEALANVEQSPELLRNPGGETLLSGVFMLFLLDPFDHPELEPLVERAERFVASLGTEVVPKILAHFEDSDQKSHERLARTLIRIGMSAVPQIMEFHNGCPDPMERAQVIYALGKIQDPGVATALPLVVRDMSSNHEELRDTATRSLGKMIAVIPAQDVPGELKQTMFDTVIERAADPISGVRAKGMRTLGKMAANGYLREEQAATARRLMEQALGRVGAAGPDRAFIVRREAEIALARLDRWARDH